MKTPHFIRALLLKSLFVLLIVLGTGFTGCAQRQEKQDPFHDEIQQTPSTQAVPQDEKKLKEVQEEERNEDDEKNITVYVTKTGKKYHARDCQYVGKSCIPIDLDEAESRGYTACSKCY